MRRLARGDPARQRHQARLVDAVPLFHEMFGGTGRGIESGALRCPVNQPERTLPLPGLHRVDAQPEPVGEIRAYGALSPRARLSGQRGQQHRRIPHRAGVPAVGAGQLADPAPVTGADLHVERAQPDVERPPAPRRTREIPMRVHAHTSLAIGLAHLPPARVEPGSRHRGHRLPIPREQVPDRLALAVMGILGDPVAPGEHEPPPAAHATRRSATAPSRCGAGTRPRSPRCPSRCPRPDCRT